MRVGGVPWELMLVLPVVGLFLALVWGAVYLFTGKKGSPDHSESQNIPLFEDKRDSRAKAPTASEKEKKL